MAKRLLIISPRIGRDDEELGRILMKNFLYAVARNEETPSEVFLANEAVRLACSGSDSLDDLRILVDNGVPVRACGTCLDYLALKDTLAVGEVGTMLSLAAGVLGDESTVVVG